MSLAAGLGIAQSAVGLIQMGAGLLKKKPKMPEYDIPMEYYQNMTDAEYESFTGLPEAQKREFLENVQRGGQTALQQSSTRKGGLGLVSSVQQQLSDSAKSLLTADSSARMERLDMVKQMRERVAEQKTIQQNVSRQNIMQKRGEIDAMRGAGMQNLAGGLGAMFQMEGEFGTLSDWMSKLKEGRGGKGVGSKTIAEATSVKDVKSTGFFGGETGYSTPNHLG